jgi:uncharacterized phage infection (PIP) family protein YhgE
MGNTTSIRAILATTIPATAVGIITTETIAVPGVAVGDVAVPNVFLAVPSAILVSAVCAVAGSLVVTYTNISANNYAGSAQNIELTVVRHTGSI